MAKILLVEDDFSLGATLEENLKLEGYQVTKVEDGEAGLELARKGGFDLVVLDVMLPSLSGLDLLAQLRATSALPVLMISAKGTPQDRIRGLELEADDYLPKPFHLKEFLLRIQRLLKRTTSRLSPPAGPIRIGQATFDFEGLEVQTSDGATELLTVKEGRLLQLLLRNMGRVVSRDEIINTVWENQENPSTRTVDNLVVKLRRWIETDPSNPQHIVSHRGIGYSLRSPHGKASHEFVS